MHVLFGAARWEVFSTPRVLLRRIISLRPRSFRASGLLLVFDSSWSGIAVDRAPLVARIS